MKVTVALIDKLIDLAEGKHLPDSQMRGDWFRQMRADGILVSIVHGSRCSWRTISPSALRSYIANHFGIPDLEAARQAYTDADTTRADLVMATGDSKFVRKRTFMGFLVNSYEPIEASICGKSLIIDPTGGTFTYIYDYEKFSVPEDVVIIGIENAENFRHISRQRSLFEAAAPGSRLLFVSRYPQNGDLARWLISVTNRYIHFGDLDLAGVNIYLTEIYRYIGERASFLIPADYEQRIAMGSSSRYDDQYMRFRSMTVTDQRVQPLVDCINRLHRGYDQEGLIISPTQIKKL